MTHDAAVFQLSISHWPVVLAKRERPVARAVQGEAFTASRAFGRLLFHWPEYLMEAGELALYMFFVCAFATLLQHPASPVRHLILSGLFRRALMGLAIGATVTAIIITPWGKQSGGHFNPAITFTFYRLGKVEFWDALFYGTAHFLGAMSGVAIAVCVLRDAPRNKAIHYAVTAPGMFGETVAFGAELTIFSV